jgi:hypothetical protein
MGRKSDAEADLATLQKLNPQLAKDLAEVVKTGNPSAQWGIQLAVA